MRHPAGHVGLVLCVALCACGEPKLECGNSDVIGTLSSMVRDRVRRVVADAYPAAFDATMRATLTKATRIAPQTMRLVEWDAISGRLTCQARLVVVVPGRAPDAPERREIDVRYRVTREDADTFLVEIGFDDMMSLFPVRAVPGR
jgi:hypothetical protein